MSSDWRFIRYPFVALQSGEAWCVCDSRKPGPTRSSSLYYQPISGEMPLQEALEISIGMNAREVKEAR